MIVYNAEPRVVPNRCGISLLRSALTLSIPASAHIAQWLIIVVLTFSCSVAARPTREEQASYIRANLRLWLNRVRVLRGEEKNYVQGEHCSFGARCVCAFL